MTEDEWGDVLAQAAIVRVLIWSVLLCGFGLWAVLTQF